jgi:hypothetical protein
MERNKEFICCKKGSGFRVPWISAGAAIFDSTDLPAPLSSLYI